MFRLGLRGILARHATDGDRPHPLLLRGAIPAITKENLKRKCVSMLASNRVICKAAEAVLTTVSDRQNPVVCFFASEGETEDLLESCAADLTLGAAQTAITELLARSHETMCDDAESLTRTLVQLFEEINIERDSSRQSQVAAYETLIGKRLIHFRTEKKLSLASYPSVMADDSPTRSPVDLQKPHFTEPNLSPTEVEREEVEFAASLRVGGKKTITPSDPAPSKSAAKKQSRTKVEHFLYGLHRANHSLTILTAKEHRVRSSDLADISLFTKPCLPQLRLSTSSSHSFSETKSTRSYRRRCK